MSQMRRERIAELNEDALVLSDPDGKSDQFDHAIIGYVERFGQAPLVLYDRSKVIKVLMDQGMTHEEAEEWFDFNIIGAWLGEGTPCFATLLNEQGEPQ